MTEPVPLSPTCVPARRFETKDPDQLAELLAPFSSGAELRARATNGGFRVQALAFRTPRVGIYRLRVSCTEAFAPPPGVVSLTVPLRGRVECSFDTPTLRGYESGEAFGLPADKPMRLRAQGDSTFLVLHLDRALIEGQIASLSGDEAASLLNIPQHLSFITPRGAAFWRRVALFWRALDCEHVLQRSALAVYEAECALALDLASAIESQATERASKITAAIAPAGLRRAEEYLMANVANAVCLADVSRESNVSVRTLSRLFASAHGMGPMGFLKQRRLEAANRALLAADYGETLVTDVALGYGFSQMGRFAVNYQLTFHESPSDTLRGSMRARL